MDVFTAAFHFCNLLSILTNSGSQELQQRKPTTKAAIMGAGPSTQTNKHVPQHKRQKVNKKQKKKEKAAIERSYTELMRYVHDNVIGDGVIFDGPYGKRSGIVIRGYYLLQFFIRCRTLFRHGCGRVLGNIVSWPFIKEILVEPIQCVLCKNRLSTFYPMQCMFVD